MLLGMEDGKRGLQSDAYKYGDEHEDATAYNDASNYAYKYIAMKCSACRHMNVHTNIHMRMRTLCLYWCSSFYVLL